MGGGTVLKERAMADYIGLSPRGRGNHYEAYFQGAEYRSIPAWAGEPVITPFREGKLTVYPRVGGGTKLRLPFPVYPSGLSPRGRGNRRKS